MVSKWFSYTKPQTRPDAHNVFPSGRCVVLGSPRMQHQCLHRQTTLWPSMTGDEQCLELRGPHLNWPFLCWFSSLCLSTPQSRFSDTCASIFILQFVDPRQCCKSQAVLIPRFGGNENTRFLTISNIVCNYSAVLWLLFRSHQIYEYKEKRFAVSKPLYALTRFQRLL